MRKVRIVAEYHIDYHSNSAYFSVHLSKTQDLNQREQENAEISSFKINAYLQHALIHPSFPPFQLPENSEQNSVRNWSSFLM